MNQLIAFVKELSDEPLMWIVYAFLLFAGAVYSMYESGEDSTSFHRFLGVDEDEE